MNTKDFSAVILAAGSGTRMGVPENKAYFRIGGQPLLFYSLKAFVDAGIGEIILVVREDERQKALDLLSEFDFNGVPAHIIPGGATRSHSSYNGVCAAKKPYVLIHDAARALVTPDIIERCMEGAVHYDACIAAMPIKDTIKVADKFWSLGDGVEGSKSGSKGSNADKSNYAQITDTPDRSTLWQAQTPQAFKQSLICEAYKKALESDIIGSLTDDASAVENFGQKVYLTEGDYTNIKVTEQNDLLMAEAILNSKARSEGVS